MCISKSILSTGLIFYNVCILINWKNHYCLQQKRLLCLLLFLQTMAVLQDSYLVRTFSLCLYCQNQCTCAEKMYLFHYWNVCDVMIFRIKNPEFWRLTWNVFQNVHYRYFWQMVWFTLNWKVTIQAYSWAERWDVCSLIQMFNPNMV